MNGKHRCVTIFFLLILIFSAGCQASKDWSEMTESAAGRERSPFAADSAPLESYGIEDVEELYHQGKSELIWLVDNSVIDHVSDVTTWNVSEANAEMIWSDLCEKIFPGVTVVQEKIVDEGKNIIFSNGVTVDIASLSFGLRITDRELFSSFSERTLEELVTEALPDCVGMELRLDEGIHIYGDKSDNVYRFYLNGIPLDVHGYGTSDDYEIGFCVSCIPEDVLVIIPHLPVSEADRLSDTDLVSAETVRTLCRADVLSSGLPEARIVILESAELTYSYDIETKQLIPAWRLSGQNLYLERYGGAHPLIHATTGEYHWAN